MAVHIRLSRAGAKKTPFYRIVVTDSRSCRDGRFIENIGTFDPSRDASFRLDRARFDYWKGVGAQASDTVQALLKKFPAAAAAATGALCATPTSRSLSCSWLGRWSIGWTK